MAQKVLVKLEDDLDGSEAETTIAFGLDGTDYEIDLNEKHADSLREAYAPYVAAARKVGKKTNAAVTTTHTGRRRHKSSGDTEEIRAWAKQRGYAVKDRGRVPAAIVAEFYAHQGRGAVSAPATPPPAATAVPEPEPAEPEPAKPEPAKPEPAAPPASRGGRRKTAAKPADNGTAATEPKAATTRRRGAKTTAAAS